MNQSIDRRISKLLDGPEGWVCNRMPVGPVRMLKSACIARQMKAMAWDLNDTRRRGPIEFSRLAACLDCPEGKELLNESNKKSDPGFRRDGGGEGMEHGEVAGRGSRVAGREVAGQEVAGRGSRVKECEIEGCEWKVAARGLCRSHYSAWHHGSLEHPRYGKYEVKMKAVSEGMKRKRVGKSRVEGRVGEQEASTGMVLCSECKERPAFLLSNGRVRNGLCKECNARRSRAGMQKIREARERKREIRSRFDLEIFASYLEESGGLVERLRKTARAKWRNPEQQVMRYIERGLRLDGIKKKAFAESKKD